jgi:hypothetical protein
MHGFARNEIRVNPCIRGQIYTTRAKACLRNTKKSMGGAD